MLENQNILSESLPCFDGADRFGTEPDLRTEHISEILRAPIGSMSSFDSWIVKSVMIASRGLLVEVCGLEYIESASEPFILAINHSQRLEAVLVPIWLAYLREGSVIRFLADWNFRLIPFVSLLLRRGNVIPVATKPARPKILNALKPLFVKEPSGFEAAKRSLLGGTSIGIFPEGTVNAHPKILLRGHHGAARLAIETGFPLIPAGIRFPYHRGTSRIPEFAPMTISIGSPIFPPSMAAGETHSVHDRGALHSILMRRIAELSGKQWNPLSQRRPSNDSN